MISNKKSNLIGYVAGVFCICFVFRFIEYMLIQTDRSILGEAFIHKLLGIAVMSVMLKLLQLKLSDIGFTKKAVLKSTCFGLIIGIAAFVIAYGIEFIMLMSAGNTPELKLYVTAYSINGNIGESTDLIFFLICIVGNIINVIMEEGMFRGLYLNILERKSSFTFAAVISSAFFGLWHIMAPLRSYIEGDMQFGSFFMACLMQILTTGLMGFMLCLLVKISGNLYIAMATHFFNNTIVNLLHVTSSVGADEYQFLRITIAQTLTFIFALIIYFLQKPKKVKTKQS